MHSAIALLLAATVGQNLSAPVEVPFKMGEDAIIVDALVNGRKVACLLDTGFTGTLVLNDSVNVGKATGTMTLRDFVGEFQARTVPVKSMELGTLSVAKAGMEVVQQPLEHMSLSYNTHTDGILGLEPLRDQVLEINFENNKLIFHPRSVDISKRKPDNQRTFLVQMLPIGRNSIEMAVKSEAGETMVLGLDTGNAFFATTHRDVLERVGLWKSGDKPKFMRSAWVASGPVDSWNLLLKKLTIFGVPVDRSVWSIIDLPASSAEGDGTVGIGFLRNFNVTIDLERRRVWLDNYTQKRGSDPVADIGVIAAPEARTKRIRIVRVMPGSPAETAGIRAGDQVLSVDGEDCQAVSRAKFDKLLEGPVGSKVQLAISRDGNLMRIDVQRAHLVNGL